MASPILFIIGAGPNIGASVAKHFAAQGYRVALASRKPLSIDVGASIHVPLDLTKPETVAPAFETVKAKLGASPSVVVYNAAVYAPDDAADPLSTFNYENYQNSLNVNVSSVLVALQQAVLGFKALGSSADGHSRTFILTGNFLNVKVVPGALTFGLTKSAPVYAIWNVVETKTYEKDGISFYYADERTPDGGPVRKAIDGPAAAEEYWRLAQLKDQGPWLDTFVKGEGYKDFAAASPSKI